MDDSLSRSEQATLWAGKLRYFTTNGDLVQTPEEAAIMSQQQAQQAQMKASEAELSLKQEQQRVAQLADQLRLLGIDPDSLT